jgi:glycosyltransferase involved in cell wall biosynthesis
MSPRVCVLMSVYNDAKNVGGSIESILQQTFTDFEFLIVNDGSTDNTTEILKKYAERDPRIIVIDQSNSGLTKALNNGLVKARGVYIARQDSDDISYPERLRLQVERMEQDSSLVLLGGNCDDAFEDGYTKPWGYETPHNLARSVFLKTPFPHSTVMMRADVCRKLGGYDESYKTSQDMEFWMRMAKSGKIAMIEQPVLRRAIAKGSISHKRRWRQFYDAMRARWVHNSGAKRLVAVYYGLRSFMICFLPGVWIDSIRKFLGRNT